MKPIQHLPILLLLVLLFHCCKNNPSPDSEPEQVISEPENLSEDLSFDPRKAIFLQSFYATSTDERSRLHFLIDDQANTYWSPRHGTGPDEGIMLRFFPEPRHFIKELKIAFPEEEQLAEIRELIVYINGEALVYPSDSASLRVDAIVDEIYIRIAQTDHIKIEESKDQNQYRSIAHFSSTHAVGISGLQLFGEADEEFKLIAPRVVKGQIMPSSNLNPIVAYHAGLLFDGKPAFAWMSGGEGSGRDDSISIRLEQPISITDIQLWNGYQPSRFHFESNARVRRFSFGLSGEAGMVYNLEDQMNGQNIRLDQPLTGRQFALKIHDIYPGRAYGDLAISELLFFEGDQSIVVESDWKLQFQEEYLSRASGTILENLMDRRVYSEAEAEEDIVQNHALILRSDGTFQSYQKEFLIAYDNFTESFSEGTWQTLEADKNGARARVFGQMTMLSGPGESGAPESGETFSRIFDEVITIFPDRIEGDRFLGVYYLE